MTRPFTLVALALLLPGAPALTQDCGGEPTDPPDGPIYDNFDDEIAWGVGGCSDVTIYAANSDDTLAVFFNSSGQVAAAQEAGASLTFQLNLATDASVIVQAGSDLTTVVCNDVVIDPPVIDEEWRAIAGGAVLTIEPDPEGGTFDTAAPATLLLYDVVLQNEAGEQVRMDDFGPVSTVVGWLPG